MPNALIIVKKRMDELHLPFAALAAGELRNKGYDVNVFDASAAAGEVLKYHIQQSNPDYLVTFDCAGFDLRLMGGDLFYNSLCCPASHVLFQAPDEYGDSLGMRMNFTMDFYVFTDEDVEYIQNNFERVPYVYRFGQYQAAPDCMGREIAVYVDGDTSEINLKIAETLSAFGIAYCVCGENWKRISGATVILPHDPNYLEKQQIFSKCGVVISTEVGSLREKSVENTIIDMAGARRLNLSKWDYGLFLKLLKEKIQ